MSAFGAVFPKYYDLIMGKEPFIITPLKRILKLHAPKPKRVLEVACGTGTIIRTFPKKLELHGLDLSKDMLQIAKKKAPHVTYHHANMINFSLHQTFDLIFCVYDSINHLNDFSDWGKTFATVEKHLDKNGVFIFDMNTFYRLHEALSTPPLVRKIGSTIMCRRVFPTNDANMFDISFQFFTNVTTDSVGYEEDHVFESAFDIKDVKKLLEKYFVVKHIYDDKKERISKRSLRVFFVCTKK